MTLEMLAVQLCDKRARMGVGPRTYHFGYRVLEDQRKVGAAICVEDGKAEIGKFHDPVQVLREQLGISEE